MNNKPCVNPFRI